MTKTQRILNALSEGALSLDDIAMKTELSVKEIRYTIVEMRKSGYIVSVPTHYHLTSHGEDWQKRVVKTPKTVIERKVQKRREKRKSNASVSMVENAIAHQPNSVFQLGGMV